MTIKQGQRSIGARRRLWRQGFRDAEFGGWPEPRRAEPAYLEGYAAGAAQRARRADPANQFPASAYGDAFED